MTRLLYKNSDFEVFSRILKNSWAENNANACKTCSAYKNFAKNLTRQNSEYQSTNYEPIQAALEKPKLSMWVPTVSET